MSLTSEELNLLIFHYLQESGFTHSAFVFREETLRHYEPAGLKVPLGALVSVVQKGLQYMEVEAHLNENGEEINCSAPFTILGEHQCEIQPEIELDEPFSRPRKVAKTSESPAPTPSKLNGEALMPLAGEALVAKQEPNPIPSPEAPIAIAESQVTGVVEIATPVAENQAESLLSGQDSRDRPFKVVLEEEATVLLGHASEVYICSWNPIFPTHIATGSNDGGGRVWRLPRSSKSDKILSHYMGFSSNDSDRDIVAIDWHVTGCDWLNFSRKGRSWPRGRMTAMSVSLPTAGG